MKTTVSTLLASLAAASPAIAVDFPHFAVECAGTRNNPPAKTGKRGK